MFTAKQQWSVTGPTLISAATVLSRSVTRPTAASGKQQNQPTGAASFGFLVVENSVFSADLSEKESGKWMWDFAFGFILKLRGMFSFVLVCDFPPISHKILLNRPVRAPSSSEIRNSEILAGHTVKGKTEKLMKITILLDPMLFALGVPP